VQEYAGQLARKKRLPVDLVLLAAATLPVTTVHRSSYASSLPEARKRIAQRDPEDVELLALAIHFNLPVWSNDNDFENVGVVWYTTAALLKKIGLKVRFPKYLNCGCSRTRRSRGCHDFTRCLPTD
jgi:predicted nucleic acid-binding protein